MQHKSFRDKMRFMQKSSLPLIIMLLLGIILVIFWLPTSRAMVAKGEVRAAIDIGSGATNLKVAKVDTKTNKITAGLFEQSIPVPYQKHLEQSGNKTFDREVMEQGIKAIQLLKEKANEYQVKKVIAVATAAFREASNAPQFAREIEERTGVQVRIINQDEEGILAFRGALATTSILPENALTWDIGGGSMQLTTLSNQGTYLVEKGKTASIPFKIAVIENIEQRDPQRVQSPNPMTPEEMQAAVSFAAYLAGQVDPFIKEKIQNPQTQVIAVGSLFNYGIKPMIGKTEIPQDKLEKAVMERANKTDQELPGGALAEVAVTNPLLVLGYMKGLNIHKVEIANVNNADGALTYPAYWVETDTSNPLSFN